MISALAQISADQLGPIVPWLLGFSATLFLINQAITFWKEHMRERPTPSDTYATKQAMEEALRQAHGRMNRERDDARVALAASELRMREEMGRLTDEVSGYNANAEERTARINQRIDDLPGKIVELLSKTKGLL